MEYIKKEELIKGEIYVFNNKFINKIQNGYLNIKCWISIPGKYFHKEDAHNPTYNIINATPEEKHWLNECIKLDKFITFEEAMKTFIPEYLELLPGWSCGGEFVGEIFDTKKDFQEQFKKFKFVSKAWDWKYILNKWIPKFFKPSTKEAYDAQFIVKEPLPQFKVIETIETITKVENNEGNQFFIGDKVINNGGVIANIQKFEYNVHKTNILAVMTTGNVIGIDKIEHYIEPKVEVEDDFILPEKWCIKRDFENDKIVTDYINKIASISHNYLLNNSYNPYLHNKTSGCCSYYKVIEDYTEITFDQFKKHVLKEEVKGEIDN